MNLVLEKLPPGFLSLKNTAPLDLFDASGLLLLSRGQLLTDKILEQLQQREVYTLSSEKVQGNASASNVKMFSKDLYWEIVGSLWSIYHDAGLITYEQISQTMERIEWILDEIKDHVIYVDNELLRLDLVKYKEHDYSTFVHSVNVAILSALTARGLGYMGQRLKYLTMGAILHDIGKIKVPSEILNKPGPLDQNEMKIIKRHPLEGEAMLRNANVLPCILKTVRQHHERWNGQGYPDALSGSQINFDAQIVAIADLYDALTADRPYRKALPPYHALEILLNSNGDFNPKIITAFRNALSLYPENTLVTLNSGEMGLVVAVPVYCPSRPLVRILFDKYGKYLDKEVYIDLMKELTYFIKSSRIQNKFVFQEC